MTTTINQPTFNTQIRESIFCENIILKSAIVAAIVTIAAAIFHWIKPSSQKKDADQPQPQPQPEEQVQQASSQEIGEHVVDTHGVRPSDASITEVLVPGDLMNEEDEFQRAIKASEEDQKKIKLNEILQQELCRAIKAYKESNPQMKNVPNHVILWQLLITGAVDQKLQDAIVNFCCVGMEEGSFGQVLMQSVFTNKIKDTKKAKIQAKGLWNETFPNNKKMDADFLLPQKEKEEVAAAPAVLSREQICALRLAHYTKHKQKTK